METAKPPSMDLGSFRRIGFDRRISFRAGLRPRRCPRPSDFPGGDNGFAHEARPATENISSFVTISCAEIGFVSQNPPVAEIGFVRRNAPGQDWVRSVNQPSLAIGFVRRIPFGDCHRMTPPKRPTEGLQVSVRRIRSPSPSRHHFIRRVQRTPSRRHVYRECIPCLRNPSLGLSDFPTSGHQGEPKGKGAPWPSP